jgi:hypothetical protein
MRNAEVVRKIDLNAHRRPSQQEVKALHKAAKKLEIALNHTLGLAMIKAGLLDHEAKIVASAVKE